MPPYSSTVGSARACPSDTDETLDNEHASQFSQAAAESTTQLTSQTTDMTYGNLISGESKVRQESNEQEPKEQNLETNLKQQKSSAARGLKSVIELEDRDNKSGGDSEEEDVLFVSEHESTTSDNFDKGFSSKKKL
ncbi:hypothetical protein HD806DRAFT_360392 [Xylariaceae sp. AK1471]|nr:hypothetical protein HD806DRAFT_360392 [Xylariaceae sp. AK1471]